MTTYQKRHQHISPMMDLIAKKTLRNTKFTTAFIRDILDLDVKSVEILEGAQIHTKEFLNDSPFVTLVDVRARLQDDTEVIIEIQVQNQVHFVKRFIYYILKQLTDNVESFRKKGQTHLMYQEMTPVYGIAVLEHTILPEESSPINIYHLTNAATGSELTLPFKNGKARNLIKFAFLELDKYNESTEIKDNFRQWLEYYSNRTFSQKPDQSIEEVEPYLDITSLTKEEKDMLDERIRIQESYDMSLDTAREEGIKQGIQQGIEQGIAQEKRQMVCAMFSNGASADMIAQLTGLSLSQVNDFLNQGLTH